MEGAAHHGCEGCGLTSEENEMEPANPKFVPCRFCVRNVKGIGQIDFWNEKWCLGANNEPILEEPENEREKNPFKNRP